MCILHSALRAATTPYTERYLQAPKMSEEEKKYGSSLNIDERVKLFNEWLESGGIKTIRSVQLLEDLIKVKGDENGKVIRETVSPLVNAAMLAYEGSRITPPFGSKEFISEYGSTLQKSLFFDQENIDTQEQFDILFEKLKGKQDTLFRGVREAKWRLYSSLQRNICNYSLSRDFKKHKHKTL